MVVLNDVKEFCKVIDYADDDSLFQNLLDAANQQVIESTGVDPSNLSTTQQDIEPHIDLAIKLLVSHWYDNREIYTTKTKVNKIPLSIDALLSTIRNYDETE